MRARITLFVAAWTGMAGLIVLLQVVAPLLGMGLSSEYEVTADYLHPSDDTGRSRQQLIEFSQSVAGRASIEWANPGLGHCSGLTARLKVRIVTGRAAVRQTMRKIRDDPPGEFRLCGLQYQVASATHEAGPAALPGAILSVLALVLYSFGLRRGLLIGPPALRGPKPFALVAIGAAIGIALAAGVLVIQQFGSAEPPGPSREALALGTLLTAVLVAPVVEEVAFRAWFIGLASRAIPPMLAAVISSAAFAVSHGTTAPFTLATLFLAGMVFAALWLRYRSILPCISAHAAYNACALALYAASGTVAG